MSFQATQPVSNLVGYLHYGNIPLPVQQLSFSISSSGTIIPAVAIASPYPGNPGNILSVVQLFLVATAAVTAVNLQSHTTTGIKDRSHRTSSIRPVYPARSALLPGFPLPLARDWTCNSRAQPRWLDR